MNIINLIKKSWRIFDTKQKVNMFFIALIVFIGSFLDLIGITAILPFVNVMMDTNIIHVNKACKWIYATMHMTNDTQFILFFAFGLIGIYIFKNAFIIFMSDAQYRFIYTNQRRLSLKMLKCYINRPYDFHISKNISEIQRNATSDVNTFFIAISSFLVIMTEGTVCLMLMIYLIMVDRTITLGVIAVLFIFSFVYLKVVRTKAFKYGTINREMSLMQGKWLRQSFEGIKEIKIVNREAFFIDRIEKIYNKSFEVSRKSAIMGVIPKPMFEAVCVSALMAVISFKIMRGVDFKYFVPVLSAFAISAFRLLPSFGRLTTQMNTITSSTPAVNSLYTDVIEVEEYLQNVRSHKSDGKKHEFNEVIKVEDVTFRYPNNDRVILDNVSLQIPKCKSVAFIGPSGAGKTTLADVILGLIEPESGKITIDGSDIYDNIDNWHGMLGYIPQVIYLMDESIKNNILFGVSEKEADEAAIWRALEEAQLKEFVESLPDGIETIVGERGVRLSGGQRQRIGIARALYNNPPVLVLDEATSSLDNETETAVMESINGLHGKKTIIIIAHRLSTIKNCDIVYKVEGGSVTDVTEEHKNSQN